METEGPITPMAGEGDNHKPTRKWRPMKLFPAATRTRERRSRVG